MPRNVNNNTKFCYKDSREKAMYSEFAAVLVLNYKQLLSGFSQIFAGYGTIQQGNGFANAVKGNEGAHPRSGLLA
jgi:hypothetical protein